MDSPEISSWRYRFLQNMISHRRQGENIVYLDESAIDSYDVNEIGWTDDSKKCVLRVPISKGKRLTVLNAGEAEGWVKDCLLISTKQIKHSSADYHEDMTGDLFETWFREKLLPNLTPNTVIVMDNASVHSRLVQKIPNKGTRKAAIIEFMEYNQIEIPHPVPTIPKLLEIIHSYNIKKPIL